jgi:ABC-type oligopeptide transport system substrate-binding subunit
VVDALVKSYADSTTLEQKISIARALDRVLLSEHYMIPMGLDELNRVAYWKGLHHPEKPPFTWTPVLQTWWR